MPAASTKQQTAWKKQLNSLASKALQAEKNAEKQVKEILKNTDKVRQEQGKKVREVIRQARSLNQTTIVKNSEKVLKDIEKRAYGGLDSVLKTLKIPNSKEVSRLNKKILDLQKRLDEVEKKSTKSASSTTKTASSKKTTGTA